jgi:ubiquinone/menaquinone biosynthesis C-methylase UbiE
MTRIARGKAAAQGIDNVTFHTGPFESFDAAPPASLDGLCAYSLLHLVRDRAAALESIQRLLKPGGFFISSTATLADGWVPYRPLIAMMRLVGKAPYVSVFGRDTLAAEVRAAGFVELETPDVGAKPTTTFLVARKPD